MEVNFLESDLSHAGTFPLFMVPALINAGLFLYSLFSLAQSKVNWIFTMFILLLAITQFSDGMMHMSTTYIEAAFWQRIAFIPWAFIASACVYLAFALTEREHIIQKRWIVFILFVPALLLSLLIVAHADQNTMTHTRYWGWMARPTPSVVNYLIFSFVSFGSLFMPILFWISWFKSRKTKALRNKFLLLAIGVTIPYIGGLIGEVLFPLLFHIDGIPLAGPLMTTFSICSLIAIKKYNLLDYSPRHQWERILATVKEGVMITDNKGKIMYANPTLCVLIERTTTEIIGADADPLIFKKSLPPENPVNEDREFQLETKSGDLIWVVGTRSACLDSKNRVIGSIWILTNINKLKHRGLVIKHNEERLNRAQEIAHVGHWELDLKSGQALWSPETCRIYGLADTDNLQTFTTWMSFVHPDDLTEVLRKIQGPKNELAEADFEHRIVLGDGTVKYVHSISKAEFDENQNPIGLHGICQDITEIKMAHAQLTASTRELETYIYRSSHDLHAPLASILGLVALSMKEVKDPGTAQYLQMIESQAKKLETVRTEFIKAMHIKDNTNFDELIDVNEMIHGILESLKYYDGFSRIRLSVDLAPGLHIRSNPFMLKTILQNLIENAIKYSDHNRQLSVLNIDSVVTDKNIKIAVEDNGVGIAAEFQDKVFDMYFRATTGGQGSGLGLYLVKKAADKLNAKLQLRSNPGFGTTFTLILPREQLVSVAA